MRILAFACAFLTLVTRVLHGTLVAKELETSILESPTIWPFCRSTKTRTCNTNTKDRQLYLEACKVQCRAGEQIMCRDNPSLGMVHFCFPKEQCPAGHFRSISVHEVTKTVTARYEPCPHEFYKPSMDCYEQCILCIQYPIPNDIVVYFKGNIYSPAIVYCNYKQGFFNYNNITAINVTNYYDGFCVSIKNMLNHPCIPGLALLPNGTCVERCPYGYDRDDSDLKFVCKPLKMYVEHGELSTEQINTTAGQTPVPDNDTNINTQSNDRVNPVTIILILVFVVVGVVVGIVVIALKRKVYGQHSHILTGHAISNGTLQLDKVVNEDKDQTLEELLV